MEIFELTKRLNIKPDNRDLYIQAVTHSTFSNEKRYNGDYQRLEFVGDALLAKYAALKTFFLYPNMDEGAMSIIRSNAVSGQQLAKFTVELGLDKAIRFGGSAKDLITNTKILADVFESLTAAIFLDKGQRVLEEFLDKNVYKFIINAKGKNLKNPKTVIQEFLQAESRESVIYQTEVIDGGFAAKVMHEGTIYGRGTGPTKKKAEIAAAEAALEKVEIK